MLIENLHPSLRCAYGNDVHVADDAKLDGCNFEVRGLRNKIVIEPGVVMSGATMMISSDDNEIVIKRSSRFKGKISSNRTGGNRLIIGERSTFGHATIILAEGRLISVGNDCMFSWNIDIRPTDSHPIFDGTSGERINYGEDIYVADDVWVGAKSTILKGAVIPKGCIVGIASVVTKRFEEERCVIAGSPARVVRSNVTWSREHLG